MIIRFIIEKYNKLKVDIAEGTFYILDQEYKANSGGWGNGAIEPGYYKVGKLFMPQEINVMNNRNAYSLFGFGWALGIEPLFKTDRTELMIHPDGGVKGTLGCIGIKFNSLEDNVKCYNTIRDAVDNVNIERIEVISMLYDARLG